MLDQWTEWMRQSMAWIEQTGPLGWVWFIVLYALSCVLFLPGSVLSVGAGAVYGFWGGTALVSAASVAGAFANFLSARFLLRGWMERRFEGSRKFRALNHVAMKDAWRMVILTRISPILPHSLVSCAFGLSRIRSWRYLLASWIGFLPLSAAYAYGGAVLGKAAKGGLQQGPWTWGLYAVEIAVTVAVTFWITRAAHRALKSVAPEVAEDAS
jgi:uncharacterized membrane protein YdjX (TVP38/TMEM64 family)